MACVQTGYVALCTGRDLNMFSECPRLPKGSAQSLWGKGKGKGLCRDTDAKLSRQHGMMCWQGHCLSLQVQVLTGLAEAALCMTTSWGFHMLPPCTKKASWGCHGLPPFTKTEHRR